MALIPLGSTKKTFNGSGFAVVVTHDDEGGVGSDAQKEAISLKPAKHARQSARSLYNGFEEIRKSTFKFPQLDKQTGVTVGVRVGPGDGATVGGGTVGDCDTGVGDRVGQPTSSLPSLHCATKSHGTEFVQSTTHSPLSHRCSKDVHGRGVVLLYTVEEVGHSAYASSLPSLQSGIKSHLYDATTH